MSMLLLLSIGCSNLTQPDWSGSGARYASGYASDEEDTALIDTAVTGGEGAPELLTGSAVYETNEAGLLYIVAGVAYADEPDDIDGGRLYYTLLGDGESLEESSRGCTEGSPDAETQALVANGQLTFQVGPVDAGVTHELAVYVVDYTRNRSNEIAVSVTGR